MIGIVPVLLVVPALLIFVPPLVMLVPAAFPGFLQFMTGVIGLRTVRTVMVDGIVQFVIGVDDAVLALLLAFGVCARQRGKNSECRKGGQRQQQLGDNPYSGLFHVQILRWLLRIGPKMKVPDAEKMGRYGGFRRQQMAPVVCTLRLQLLLFEYSEKW
jgi:hypothetical protein